MEMKLYSFISLIVYLFIVCLQLDYELYESRDLRVFCSLVQLQLKIGPDRG